MNFANRKRERGHAVGTAPGACPFVDSQHMTRAERTGTRQTRFLPFLLERKDRMSMASGFEARVPFCDYRLVEYVWNIPWDMKNADNIEKGILRRAFAGALPDDVRNRKKSAYPSAQSPAYLAAIHDWARQIVSDPNAAIAPLIDTNAARSLVDNNTADIPGVTLVPLYERIIQLNEWLKKYEVTLVL